MGRSLLTPTSPQYRWTFQPRDSRIIESTKQLKGFPFDLDMNSDWWGQATAQNGSRSSSATSYLGPQFAAYPNLHVLLHTRVTRVLPNYIKWVSYGNSSTLNSVGVKPMHNLPSVGQNLSDHSLTFLSFLVNRQIPLRLRSRNWPGGKLHKPVPSSILHQATQALPSFESRNTTHYELIFSNGLVGPPLPTGSFLSIIPAVVSPAYRMCF
ncbi:hypothetical protein B0H13DRAFT_2239164 [Mycena leptocephala]|nr:hypothetical protein B0H13DRAFT_2239164 [Mycena leptocephala]